MSPAYYVVWSGGPAIGDGTPAGTVHRDELDARRAARGREGALRFAHGDPGPESWSVWIDEVTARRELEVA